MLLIMTNLAPHPSILANNVQQYKIIIFQEIIWENKFFILHPSSPIKITTRSYLLFFKIKENIIKLSFKTNVAILLSYSLEIK